jgi:hypothetical protein
MNLVLVLVLVLVLDSLFLPGRFMGAMRENNFGKVSLTPWL